MRVENANKRTTKSNEGKKRKRTKRVYKCTQSIMQSVLQKSVDIDIAELKINEPSNI